jgi:two-component system, NtrC family, nitrogen regulation response regulator NtrX
MPKILIIDDEKAIRQTLKEILGYEKYAIEEAKDGEEGLNLLLKNEYDVVLCDIKMPKMDGIEVLEKAKNQGVSAQFIMISAHGTIDTAVDATKKGAYDFIQKPPDLNRLLVAIKNALDNKTLLTETKVLRQKIAKGYEIIGQSPAILLVKEMIARVAPTEAKVLITGPNGSGKELVARQLHKIGKRSSQPFIEVNCAAIPSELIESELFGHEKGSFTSAIKNRTGKFEQADGGTLFLDEIGDMSLNAQAKVLRAIQERKISKVGGEKEIEVDVRLIAATNKNLQKEIEAGNFREDLYHRLAVVIIQVPSLDDRKEDIELLALNFLNEIAKDYGSKVKTIEKEAIEYLTNQKWSGNIRELRNVIERLYIMSSQTITLQDTQKYAAK